ncbi:MAG: tRNA pseudouridine(55) synthase TruB [Candidatus Uhrbacteria bacterium]
MVLDLLFHGTTRRSLIIESHYRRMMSRTIAIWKPKGPTSHDIVDTVRRITGERTVGHAGTLDPMAEGILVVGIGREATRRLHEVVAGEKEYVATIRLGATSATDDAEGEITPTPSHSPSQGEGEKNITPTSTFSPSQREGEYEGVGRTEIERILNQFVGCIKQIPPMYSAVKLRGVPAYKLARRGTPIILKPREVEIKKIEITNYAWPELHLHVICGPGVYIRALARDIGAALGTGGYLTALTRTRVGIFTASESTTLDGLARSLASKRT